MMAGYCVKNSMKFGPVTPELTLLICERQVEHGPKTGHFSEISPDILDRFLETFYHMKANDGSVPYFPRVVGMATK